MANHIGPRQQFQIDAHKRQFDTLERQFYGLCSRVTTIEERQDLQHLFRAMQQKAAAIPQDASYYEYALGRAEDALHTVAFALFANQDRPVDDGQPADAPGIAFEQTTGALPLDILTQVLTFASDAVHSSVSRDFRLCNPHLVRSLQEELIANTKTFLTLIDDMHTHYPRNTQPAPESKEDEDEDSNAPEDPNAVSNLLKELTQSHVVKLSRKPLSSPMELSGVSHILAMHLVQLFQTSSNHLPPDVLEIYQKRMQNELTIPLLRRGITFATPPQIRQTRDAQEFEAMHAKSRSLLDQVRLSLKLNDVDHALTLTARIPAEELRQCALSDIAYMPQLTDVQINDAFAICIHIGSETMQNYGLLQMAHHCFTAQKYAEGLMFCSKIRGSMGDHDREFLISPFIREAPLAIFQAMQTISDGVWQSEVLPKLLIPALIKAENWKEALALIHNLPHNVVRKQFFTSIFEAAHQKNRLFEIYDLGCEAGVNNHKLLFKILQFLSFLPRTQPELIHSIIFKLVNDDSFEMRAVHALVFVNALQAIQDPSLQSELGLVVLRDYLKNGNIGAAREFLEYITLDPWLSLANDELAQFNIPQGE